MKATITDLEICSLMFLKTVQSAEGERGVAGPDQSEEAWLSRRRASIGQALNYGIYGH